MIRLTKKLLFAIEAVLDIAYNGGQVPVRSSEITEREGIPRRYLEPVLQELVRQKILLGIRGPSGGYRLARERRRISLGDIVRTVRELETAEDPISDPAGSALGHQVVEMATVAGGMNAIQFGEDGMLTGAACWRADGTPIGIAGGLADAGVRFGLR